MHRFMRFWLWPALCLGSAAAWAGGSGLNVVVVVNQNSTSSVQLGNDYCEQRGVPPQNFFRMTNWTQGPINWSLSDFTAKLQDPLLAMLAARNLTNQVSFILLSMDIPYRVVGGTTLNSTTSTLFYGFKPNDPSSEPGLPDSCTLPDLSSNSYCYSELPFTLSPPNTATTNAFLAMMLTGTNLADAELLLARGVASDSSFPTETVYLEKTSDWARNVRFLEFDNAIFESRLRALNTPVRIESDSTSFTNLLGLTTGLATLSLPGNAFVPGAMGDSLTSFAGFILEESGQTSLLAFLKAGASGSYGTVVEPCAYLEKFPNPIDYYYQQRGFSLAEAYYQSLQNPYQGLLAGEPLSAPFARAGSASWNSLTNGATLSGSASLNPSFAAAAPDVPLDQVDLFIDGSFVQTLTNIPPRPGNQLEVTLNATTVDYQVPPGATLWSAAAGLASKLNTRTSTTRVQAFPIGDRIQLQGLDLTTIGDSVLVGANASAGTASQLTTRLAPARDALLDSIAAGYLGVLMQNNPGLGDSVVFTFTKTNGTQVPITFTDTVPGMTLATFAQNLFNQINTNPGLQSADGCYAADFYADASIAYFMVYARSGGWPAARATITLAATGNVAVSPTGTSRLEDNLSDLRPRNHLVLNSGVSNLAVPFQLDTTRWPDGFHEMTVVAYEGSSVRTQTRASRTVKFQNTGLSASIVSSASGTNAPLGAPLQFTISANAANIARIELFSTGGLIGVVSNQANAVFQAPSALLGLGLHPFYALVSDTAGHQYKTETISIRLVPSFTITISSAPPALSWPAEPGRQYDVLMTTNLSSPFQVVDSVTASNSIVQWPILTPGALTSFYRVRLR